MQYALVNDLRTEAAKNLKGLCPGCRKEVIAKCGNIRIHHWAHKQGQECDAWWEPETEWHRNWKNNFPVEYREIILKNEKTGGTHRADIHTNSGVTIEFQNSGISADEIKSREQFYRKLIWVLNAQKWKERFDLSEKIPNPNGPLLKEFDFVNPGRSMYFYKKSELSNRPVYSCRLYDTDNAELKTLVNSDSHFLFTWKNQSKVWFTSNAFVFLDFGADFLYWLKERKQLLKNFWFVKKVKKSDFIAKYSNNF